MDFGILTTAIAGIVGGIAGYLTTKSNNKLTAREHLSKDQYQFIAELKEMIDKQSVEIAELKSEIKLLQKENAELLAQNSQLQIQIEKLSLRIKD